MFLQDGQFPNIGFLIRHQIIPTPSTSVKFLAFVMSSESSKFSDLCFSSGTDPLVVIQRLPAVGTIRPLGIYRGERNPWYLNKISIRTDQATAVEFDPEWKKFAGEKNDEDKSPPDYREVSSPLEKLIPHEAVHWARFRAKKPDQIALAGRIWEAGAFFDHMAFGATFGGWAGIDCGNDTSKDGVIQPWSSLLAPP